jgi:pyruvate dehydrogenase E2 component (dihydrolipoyllysine-residue acetyltransferase)
MNSNEKIQLIEIPKWGLSMEEGTIIEWLISEGDNFSEGDLIAEIESSKIVNELEAPVSGTLRKILATVDETLPVGAPIAIVADQSVSDDEIAQYMQDLAARGSATATGDGDAGKNSILQEPAMKLSPESSQRGASNSIPSELATGSSDLDVHATLHARRLARQVGVNLRNVSGTGRNDRISRQDVIDSVTSAGGAVASELLPPSARRRAMSSAKDAVREASPGFDPGDLAAELAIDTPLGGMRRTIGARLTQSKRVSPHFRVVMDVEIDRLLALRKEKNSELSELRISVNDYLIKACATALVEVPECNIQFDGKTIRRFHDAHVSVAVALDAGLISPIVKHANKKSLTEIAETMRTLTAGARNGTLSSNDYQGGTFTVSNLGSYGVKHFDAIINPPQAAILAVGVGEQRPVVRNGKAAIATVMTLTLSSDHRIIDGALAARFLSVVQGYLESPASMGS